MWIVYNRQDSWECGFEVHTENEAIEFCSENEEYTYKYVDRRQTWLQ